MLNGTVLAAETAGPNLRVRDKRPSQLWAGERTSHQRRWRQHRKTRSLRRRWRWRRARGLDARGGVCERRVAGWNPPALDWTSLPNENQRQKLHNQTWLTLIHHNICIWQSPNRRSTYSWPYRCSRLLIVGRKEPIKVLFTLKGNHGDLQRRHHGMTHPKGWENAGLEPGEHKWTWTCDAVTRKRPNHREETIRLVLNVCSRKPGGGDRSV